MNLRTRYCAALPFPQFLDAAEANAALWRSIAQRAAVPADAVERLRATGGRWHLLVIAEDWCGDAVNTLPVLARLAEAADNLDLRVISCDAHPELMAAHRSPRGADAIPVVMILDECFVERAWWGSRPVALQRWMEDTGVAMPKEERYREARRWYARDRGVSAVDEVIALIEHAAVIACAA